MATRNVVLSDHLEQVVNDLVVSGRYQNVSEVLREGVRLLEQREAEESAKQQTLREMVSIGLKSLDERDRTIVRAEELSLFLETHGEQANSSSAGIR
ncbi:hypothetical protein ALP39_200472 [Pseudomonas marginalis pv. marginalis]|nr:hypothetical protein ALP39_200472 [Pseudomonas marginalis pv. marginalis]